MPNWRGGVGLFGWSGLRCTRREGKRVASLRAGECVCGRCEVFAVQREGRVGVRFLEVAEDLIVRAVFLDDIDDVVNSVFAGGELDAVGVALSSVRGRDLRSPGGEVLLDVSEGNARERAVGHCW